MKTLLFTDIEGSTVLLRRVGLGYAELLGRHHEIVRAAIRNHGGVERGTEGDSFFVTFDSVSSGVSMAVEAQRALTLEPWPGSVELRVRMGLHVGEVIENPTGLVGLAVHQAARIATSAHGGQVVVSDEIRTLAGSDRDDVQFADLGTYELRDVGAIRLFQLVGQGLHTSFPRLRASLTIRHNLPLQPTSFVGRGAEVAEVSALLETHRVVTLAGPGGVGKTRLALEVGGVLLDRFSAGVWLVELASISTGDAVVASIARVLDVRADSGRSLTDKVFDIVSDREMVIILDNCEHVIDGVASFVDAISRRCANVRVLTTSREPLRVDAESVLRIGGLSLPIGSDTDSSEAAQLFIERVGLDSPGMASRIGEARLIDSLCTHLDGVPLALELAAAQASSMSLVEIVDRLDDRFALLDQGSRTAPSRHQTLESLIDWSYEMLTPSEQEMFVQLAVFPGSWTLRAAEKICTTTGSGAFHATRLHSELVSKSLVQTEGDLGYRRYRLLETIRAYAANRLDRREGDASQGVERRHLDFYADFAVRPEHIQIYDIDRVRILRSEMDNLWAALDTAVRLHATGSGFELALAMYELRPGPDHRLAARLRDLLDVPSPAESAQRVDALETIAGIITYDDPALADAYAIEGVRSAISLKDEMRISRAYRRRCSNLLTYGGNLDTALELAEAAVQHAVRSEAARVIWGSHHVRGNTRLQRGELNLATQDYESALSSASQSGIIFGIHAGHLGLGTVALAQMRLNEARSHFRIAAEHDGLADHMIADATTYLAQVALQDGDPLQARDLLHNSLRIHHEQTDPEFLAMDFAGLGQVALQTGQTKAGVTLLAAALSTATEANTHVEYPMSRSIGQAIDRAKAMLNNDEFDRAFEHGQRMTVDDRHAFAVEM